MRLYGMQESEMEPRVLRVTATCEFAAELVAGYATSCLTMSQTNCELDPRGSQPIEALALCVPEAAGAVALAKEGRY